MEVFKMSETKTNFKKIDKRTRELLKKDNKQTVQSIDEAVIEIKKYIYKIEKIVIDKKM
jgi:hypothetical protein